MTPEQTLLDQIKAVLSKVAVNEGSYELVFSDAYQLIWKHVREYAKALGSDPSKPKKQGAVDPIFTAMNQFMYPGDADIAPTLDQTADKILIEARTFAN